MHADRCAFPLPLGAAVGSLVHWPFDALRLQHAHAVQAGLVPRSLLESRDFEHGLAALEQLALGPLARHN
jgi:hypothetical protein